MNYQMQSNNTYKLLLIFLLSFSGISGILTEDLRAQTKNSTTQNPKIAIIGAGIAGSVAAYQLKKEGVAFHIYEGRDRIGGRIQNQQVPGYDLRVEMGGTYIDTRHSAFRNLLKELDVPVIALSGTKPDNYYQYFAGQTTRHLDNVKIYHKSLKRIEDDLKKMKEDQVFTQLLKQISTLEYLEFISAPKSLIDLVNVTTIDEYGQDIKNIYAYLFFSNLAIDLKTNSFDLRGELGDEKYILKNGSSLLLSKLQEQMHNQLFLNHTLLSIQGDKNGGYILRFNNNNKTVVKQYEKLLITVPTAVLAQNKIDIEPLKNHPRYKLIQEKIPTGRNMKYFMFFNKPIWKEKTPHSRFNLITKNYWVWENGDELVQDKLYGLTVFLGGSQIDWFEKLGIEQAEKSILAALEKVLPEVNKHFIKSMLGTQWHKEPLSLGAYPGYVRPGESGVLEMLRNPDFGNIQFAGDGWSENYMGYMNGAIESALKACQRIKKDQKSVKQVVYAAKK